MPEPEIPKIGKDPGIIPTPTPIPQRQSTLPPPSKLPLPVGYGAADAPIGQPITKGLGWLWDKAMWPAKEWADWSFETFQGAGGRALWDPGSFQTVPGTNLDIYHYNLAQHRLRKEEELGRKLSLRELMQLSDEVNPAPPGVEGLWDMGPGDPYFLLPGRLPFKVGKETFKTIKKAQEGKPIIKGWNPFTGKAIKASKEELDESRRLSDADAAGMVDKRVWDPPTFPTFVGGLNYFSKHSGMPIAATDELIDTAAQALRSAWDEQTMINMSKAAAFTPERVPMPDDPIVKTLVEKIKEASSVRKKQTELVSHEKRKRIAELTDKLTNEFNDPANDGLIDRDVFNDAIRALGGEYDKVKWQSLSDTDPLTSQQYDDLVRYIRGQSDPTKPFDFVNKWKAFIALTEGDQVPQPAQIQELRKLFGSDIIDMVEEVGWKTVAADMAFDVLSLPRTMIASMDLSAPLRQGRPLMGAFPEEFKDAAVAMHKVAFSEKNALALEASIKNHPMYNIAHTSGLFYAERGFKAQAGTTAREEKFASRFASYIPGIKASERAYASFLNKYRHDIFYRTVSEWQASGVKKSLQDYQDLATMINWGSGRGPLPKGIRGRLADILSAAFFAPRFATSGPAFVVGGAIKAGMDRNAAASKMWARSMVGYAETSMMWLRKLHLAGAEVELDPRSSDFGKGKIGTHRFDFFGGWQPLMRYTAQMVGNVKSAQRKSITTGYIYDVPGGFFQSRAEIFGRFMRSKENPAYALGSDIITGEDFLGESVEPRDILTWDFLLDRAVPMLIGDIMDVVEKTSGVGHDINQFISNPLAYAGTTFSLYGGGFQTFSTSRDLQNELTEQMFPGKMYEDLIPGSQEQIDVNRHPTMLAYWKERESERPKDDPQEEWFEGSRLYNEAVERLEQGGVNPATGQMEPGAIERVLSAPVGQMRVDHIRKYKQEKYQSWLTAISKEAAVWKAAQLNRWDDPHRLINIFRDAYHGVVAPRVVIQGMITPDFDFDSKDLEQQYVINQAISMGVITRLNEDGTPSLEDPAYRAIVSTAMPVSRADVDSDRRYFFEAIKEYDDDMAFLSDNFFYITSDVMKSAGVYDAYVAYKYSNRQTDIRDDTETFEGSGVFLNHFFNPELHAALNSATFQKKMRRSVGWENDDPNQPTNPIDARTGQSLVPPEQKALALEVSRRLLKWGFIQFNRLPKEMQAVLMQESMERERELGTIPVQQ